MSRVVRHRTLVTAELLNLTKWIADYYYAPWARRSNRAWPPGINVEPKRSFRSRMKAGRHRGVNSEGGGKRGQLGKMAAKMERSHGSPKTACSTPARGEEFNKNRASAIARELERAVTSPPRAGSSSAQVKPKRQQAVRFDPARAHRRRKPLNEQQGRVIKSSSIRRAGRFRSAHRDGRDKRVGRPHARKARLLEVFTREVRATAQRYRPLNDGDLRPITETTIGPRSDRRETRRRPLRGVPAARRDGRKTEINRRCPPPWPGQIRL